MRMSAMSASYLAALSLAAVAGVDASFPLPQPDDKALDCAVRGAAHAFAASLQGGAQEGLFDALSLGSYCGEPPPRAGDAGGAGDAGDAERLARWQAAGAVFWADASRGADSNAGTAAAPFASVARGVGACRAAGGGNCTLLLFDSAPFVLPAPLRLTAADSGLTVARAASRGAPVLSGAAPLRGWAPLDAARGVWRAALPPGAARPRALLAGARRLPRARWPNAETGDWERERVPSGYTNASAWAAPRAAPPAQELPFPAAERDFDVFFPDWKWARGGIAEGAFDPPEGYWISNKSGQVRVEREPRVDWMRSN
jgi:hypothetical protein